MLIDKNDLARYTLIIYDQKQIQIYDTRTYKNNLFYWMIENRIKQTNKHVCIEENCKR